MATRPATRITGLRTVAVPVTDQDRALAFYVDTLGFERRLEFPMGEGARWIDSRPPAPRRRYALVPASQETPVGGATGIRLTTSDAEADHAAFARRRRRRRRHVAVGGRAADVRVSATKTATNS